MPTKEFWIVLFFLFGCWFKLVPGALPAVFYNIWVVLVIFWTVINAVGVRDCVINKRAKKTAKLLTDEIAVKWMLLYTMAIVSFMWCEEYWITLGFMCTAVPFMLFHLYEKDKKRKKK